MKKVKILLMCLILVLTSCGKNKLSDEELYEQIIKNNDISLIEDKFNSVYVKANEDENTYSFYAVFDSSQYNQLKDNKVVSTTVYEKKYTYGINQDRQYFTEINLLEKYDKYFGVLPFDFNKVDFNSIEKTSVNRILIVNIKDKYKKEYIDKYNLKENEIDKIEITFYLDIDEYYITYRSDAMIDNKGEKNILAKYEYSYGQENPDIEIRNSLDDHNKNTQDYRLITVVLDPDTDDEQLITFKAPVDDEINILMDEKYHIDLDRTAINEKDTTYYLVDNNNLPKKEIIKDKEHDASGFVLLSDVVPDVILEIRYYSSYNFVGTRIDGYIQPIALATRQAAEALKKVSDELLEQGYRLKIYDAYRPADAEDHFYRWSKDNDEKMKDIFYPQINKNELYQKGYIAQRTSHSRGSAFDLTLVDIKTGKEVDMGTVFDYFSEESHTNYNGVSEEQFNNRMLLKETMIKYGFRPFEKEWWHFTLENEPYPDTYFNFSVSVDSLDN